MALTVFRLVPVALGLVASGACAQRQASPTAAAPARPPVVNEAEATRALARLVPLPSARGNGCADYMKLTALEGDPPPFPPLEVTFGMSASSTDPDEQDRLRALASDPGVRARLELLRQGAKKASCEILGVVFPWPEGPNPMRARVPLFGTILAHAELARFVAFEHERQGQRDEAIAWLESLVIVGWHLQQEPLLLVNMVGVRLAAEAGGSLAELSKRAGDAERAGRWRAFAGLTEWRRYEEYKDLLPGIVRPELLATDAGVERLAALVESRDLLRGARVEGIIWTAVAHLFRPGLPEATPRQRELLARWGQIDDPRLAATARHFAPLLDVTPAVRAKVAAELRADLAPPPATAAVERP